MLCPCCTQRPDYAASYTLNGCHDGFFCGVFTRVEARCAAGSGARCPAGASAAGNADPTLCDGAPVYQQTGGSHSLLLRVSEQGGGTRWKVSESAALDDCEFHEPQQRWELCGPGCQVIASDLSPGRPGYAPTAPAYGQWSTHDYQESISVVAGGGR